MLFGNNYSKAGPGVSPDAPRRKGLMRFFELVGRDFSNYWKAGLLSILCFVPMASAAFFSVLSSSLLPALLGGLIGGAIAGPCLVGLFDTVLRTLRDEPGYWWHTYKMAVKRSAKASLVPGAITGLCLSSAVVAVYCMLGSDQTTLVPWILTILCLIVLLGAIPYLWMQIALFDLSGLQLLKNTFAMWMAFFPRTLLAIGLQLAYWLVIAIFLPYSELALPFTSLWLPTTAACLAVYKPFEKALHVEASIREVHEEKHAEEQVSEASSSGKQS